MIYLIFCVLTYAFIYVLIHQIIFRFYLLKYSLFFQVLFQVLKSSIDVVFILSIWVAIHLKSTKPYLRLAQRTRNQKGNWLNFFSVQRLIEYKKVDYVDIRVKRLICTLHTSGVTPSHVVLLNQIVRSSLIWHRLLQTLKLWKKGLMSTLTLDQIITERRNNELCRAQTRDMERELHVSAVSEPSERVHSVDSKPDPVVKATAPNRQFDNGLLQSGECVDIQSHGENKSVKFDKNISINGPHKSGSASSTNKTSVIVDICITWMSALFSSMFVGISGIDMPYFGTSLLLFVTVASCWIAKSAKYEFSVCHQDVVNFEVCTILSWAKIVYNSVKMGNFSFRTVSHYSYIASHNCQRW